MDDGSDSFSKPRVERELGRTSAQFFSTENTARIGRVTIPFPFSALLGILAVPVLFVAAGVSIPVTLVREWRARRREERFAAQMRKIGRSISWAEARSEVERGHGTFIGEYLSLKGPYRLWWTSDDVSVSSPHKCCFDEIPWGETESSDFFDWCCSRLTDAHNGTARLVELGANDGSVVRQVLRTFGDARRYVSTSPRLAAKSER